jgi:hypothetical protein
MKKIILSIIMLALLLSCTPPTQVVKNTIGRTVMNSLWQVVPMETINAAGRSLSRDFYINLEENVAAYNASHIDDQWFIVDGEIPGIDLAPAAQIYVVDPITHIPLTYDNEGVATPLSYTNWPRAQLVSNYIAWTKYAQDYGGILYIDVIPPAPIIDIPTAEQIYAEHSIYVIDCLGNIISEEHCSLTFIQSDWPGWTLDTFFVARVNAWGYNVNYMNDGENRPWTEISGRLYP